MGIRGGGAAVAGKKPWQQVRESRHRERMGSQPAKSGHRGGKAASLNWRERERSRLSGGAARRRLSEGDDDAEIVDNAVPCASSVTYAGGMEFEILQSFLYRKFPFDYHTIQLEFQVEGADLFTCSGRDGLATMGLDEDNAEELLLPSTMTWMLDGSLDEAVSMSHPIEPLTGEPIRSRCNVAIKIRRNWVVYFVKQICMSLLVSTGGLLALLMQPSEMLGDRCAQLLVAILIIVTSFQSDLGLGNLSYLIWVDYFNVMQLVVLLMGLVQTMVIHRLMQRDSTRTNDIVSIVDRVFRCLLPLMLYPLNVVGAICYGIELEQTGAVIVALGFGGSFVIGAIWTYKVYVLKMRAREAAIADALNVSDPNVPRKCDEIEYHHVGDINIAEMRLILREMYRDLPRKAVAIGMKEAQKFMSHDDELDLNSFVDAFEAATRAVNEYAGSSPVKVEVSMGLAQAKRDGLESRRDIQRATVSWVQDRSSRGAQKKG